MSKKDHVNYEYIIILPCSLSFQRMIFQQYVNKCTVVFILIDSAILINNHTSRPEKSCNQCKSPNSKYTTLQFSPYANN